MEKYSVTHREDFSEQGTGLMTMSREQFFNQYIAEER